MAQQHLNTLITASGLPEDDIATILALPEDAKDFKPDDYQAKIRTSIETAVKNDPKFWEGLDENNVNEGFKKKIESQQYGRAAGVAKGKVLKALGITEEDLSDLTAEEKAKYEVVIAKAAEKFATNKSGDKETQKLLIEARKKLEELETDIPVREGKIKQDYEKMMSDEKLDFIILAELAGIENLKAPASYLARELTAALKEENYFVINGIKAQPKQKANPTLDMLEGSKVLSLKDLIVKKLKADGLIDEKEPSGGKQGGKIKVDVDPDGKGGLAISSHIMEQIKANQPAV